MPLSAGDKLGPYAGQILDALDAAHRKAITHRETLAPIGAGGRGDPEILVDSRRFQCTNV